MHGKIGIKADYSAWRSAVIVVNRKDFIAWSEGTLLDRRGDNIISLGDQVIHEKAQEALDAGETIALTINGEIVSHMKLVDEAYKEFVPK